MSGQEADYLGREQTLVKHFILEKYLERFAHIVGSWADVITYVDCFSGPWNVYSKELRDSSFHIAVEQLRKAQATHAEKRERHIQLRCFFVEKDAKAYAKLKEFADTAKNVEIETRNAGFENVIDDILAFISKGGPKSFPFIFVDPTGWSGFGMDHLGRLLKLKPGEVLINFMTGHIRRFIESPNEQTQESFKKLFGSEDYREKIAGLSEKDREDALVDAYVENVRKVGGFDYVCAAIVLHPEFDRTHFHLIYATRNRKGVEVFKETEKKAMSFMEKVRGDTQKRKREKRTGQWEMFSGEVTHKEKYFQELRERYTAKAKGKVVALLQSQRHVPYDDIWIVVPLHPLVWESDLKEWIEDWRKGGKIKLEGMKPRQQVPKYGENNILAWQ